MTLREALTSALAGPLVKARARSAGRRALRADARQEQDRLRQQPPRLADRPRVRRADDRADAREPALADELLPELVHEPRDVVPDRVAVGELQVLDVGAALVRRLDDAEDPAAVAPAGAEERLERVAAEVRVDRHRVGKRRALAARLEIGGRVGARGRADVAALRVREHEQAGRARVGADVLEGAQAVRAERLEERELRLHADDVRRDRVHDPAAEAAAGVGRRVGREVRVAARARPAAGRAAGRARPGAASASARPPRRAGRERARSRLQARPPPAQRLARASAGERVEGRSRGPRCKPSGARV